ncbi:MAG: polysaccharide biosynthesis protein [Lachnospiraceae bacterium]|nr:polysaccharide biosynthesis protein [Lachnospiraceae bacterium]
MAETKRGQVARQAAFLMAAQLISSVIGLLYRSPLHRYMGEVGDGYYQYAYEWYTIILLIASYSIPSAVSKVTAERLAVKQYRNANKVFRAALIYVTIAGGIGASVAFFGAPFILSKQPDAVLALRVLAPTLFLSGFLGVFRGYFQAHNTMKPTAISQIAEQILNAVFSVLMAYLLAKPYFGNDILQGKYGAAGGTIGTGAGVVTGLLVMLLTYAINRKVIRRRIAKDRHTEEESYSEVFRVILMMCTPIILATCVYQSLSIVDQVIFTNVITAKGYTSRQVSILYGLYGYRVKPIINIPIALASATSTALIPAVATSISAGSKKGAVAKVDECIKMTLFISIPSAVGIAILSYPIIYALYPGRNMAAAAELLSLGAVSVIFYSLSTVTNGVLQGLGRPSVPVRNSAIALGVNVIVTFVTVKYLGWHVYGIVAAVVIYSFTIMLLNAFSIRKYLGYTHSVSQFVTPVKSAVIMGAAVAAVYWAPKLLLKSVFDRYLGSAVLMVAAVVTGILVYFAVYGSNLSDQELRRIPMGTRILGILRKLHIR